LLVKVPKTLDEKIIEKIPKVKDGKKGLKWLKWDKGEKGDKGDKGDPLKFEDLTPQQIARLEWPEWPRGIPWVCYHDSTAQTPVEVSWNTTITETSWNYLYIIDTTLSDITINLPTAIGNTANYQFKRISSWTYEAHIVPFGTETIDTYNVLDILFKNTNIPIVSDGSNWLIL
jgi:hypothetical protein